MNHHNILFVLVVRVVIIGTNVNAAGARYVDVIVVGL